MNKRGQFYLIAAVVIAGLIVGMGMNYTSINGSSNDDSTDKILLQIQSEASQVIDNAVFNGLSNSERNANLDLLLGAYSQNNPDTEFVLIFGSKEEIQAETEYNKINVVSHSMGGLATRGYIQDMATGPDGSIKLYSNDIDKYVIIASPMYGTYFANFF